MSRYIESEIGHVRIKYCADCRKRVAQLRVHLTGKELEDWLCMADPKSTPAQTCIKVADALRDAATELMQ